MTYIAAPLSYETTPTPSSTILNIWVTRTQEDSGVSDWRVDRIVLTGAAYVNTITVTATKFIGDFLTPQFADVIEKYLPVAVTDHILTASDFAFETRGLTLSCLRVTGRKMADGVQRVMLTFRRVLGDISILFHPKEHPSALREAQADISTRVLVDIIMPALNLVEFDPTRANEDAEMRVAQCLERLSDNKNDLKFYSTLLTRYVRQLDSGDTVAQSARLAAANSASGQLSPVRHIEKLAKTLG